MKIDAETLTKISNLLAKEEILRAMHRYTRGFDRFDRLLMMSAYHPDAVLTSGFFTGSAEDQLDLALRYHEEHETSYNMMQTNCTCEFDGHQAHTEVYWIQASVARGGGRKPSDRRPVH